MSVFNKETNNYDADELVMHADALTGDSNIYESGVKIEQEGVDNKINNRTFIGSLKKIIAHIFGK